MRSSGCLFFVLLAVGVVWGVRQFVAGSRLLFVASTTSPMTVWVDDRAAFTVAAGGHSDTNVSWGKHVVRTEDARGSRTVTVRGNLDDAQLVPANDEQCFLVLNVTDAYLGSPGHPLPADWRPGVEARLSSDVVVAPKRIWATNAPGRIKLEAGETARILYPYACDTDEAVVIDEWLRRTFGH